MSDGGPIDPLGIITDGVSFELDQPRQVVFAAWGTCAAARSAYLESTLDFVGTGQAPLLISRTVLNTPTETRYTNGASLFLQRGKYTLTARVRADVDGMISRPNIDDATATINTDPNFPYFPGQTNVSGSSESFMLVSTGQEKPVTISAQIKASLPRGDYLSGSLRVTDLSTNSGVATPRALLRGVNQFPLQLEAMPLYLKPARIYRFDCDMIYGGQSPITQSISLGSFG